MPCFGGLDGAKAPWDMALRPPGERWAVVHDASEVATRVERFQTLPPTLLVLAATGGLERVGTSALAAAGLPVVVVHPRQARDGARAPGPLAPTEAVAARALAHCADVIRPTPRPRPAAPTHERRALLGRRPPRIGMRTAAQHRRAGTSARLTKDLRAPMTWLKTAMATLDNDRETTRRASPLWRERAERLPRAQGLGPVGARTLLRARPAVGGRAHGSTSRPEAVWRPSLATVGLSVGGARSGAGGRMGAPC